MAARLKVFCTSDGLTDYLVATSSRAKALAAWGVHQDLFKAGRAREVDDPALVAEATARPETVVRRAASPTAVAEALAAVKAQPKPAAKAAKAVRPAATPPAAEPPPRRDLRRIAALKQAVRAAEAALRDAERRHAQATNAADRQVAALEAQLKAAEAGQAALRREQTAEAARLARAVREADAELARAEAGD